MLRVQVQLKITDTVLIIFVGGYGKGTSQGYLSFKKALLNYS
jgi:hypothetical protein